MKIRSKDPNEHPALRFNYLSTEQDRREWVEAIRVARRLLNQPAMAPYNDGEISPGPSVETDEEILAWVAKDGETALHPSCTCKMGTDEMSVVDPASMRVHGVEGLRVVDAHPGRTGRMQRRFALLRHPLEDLLVGPHLFAR